MKSYLITYELNNPGQNINVLHEAVKKLGKWWHCLDSSWIIKSNQTAEQIRDHLKSHLDRKDKLFVVLLSGEAAMRGFDTDCAEWLRKNL